MAIWPNPLGIIMIRNVINIFYKDKFQLRVHSSGCIVFDKIKKNKGNSQVN